MTESETARTALKFVNEINRHDLESISALLSEDHLFIDWLGNEVRGRDRTREGWSAYFQMFPDYHIGVREWFQNGRVVAMIGVASGDRRHRASRGEPLEIPAAWRAVVRDHQLAQWQVFAGNQPVCRSWA